MYHSIREAAGKTSRSCGFPNRASRCRAFDCDTGRLASSCGGSTLVYPPGTPPYVGICMIIGQPDSTTLTAGQPPTPTDIGNPTAVAFDSKGNLWAVDTSNNRVLEYKPPYIFGEAASLVIGQTSLTGTTDTSSSGGLFGPTGIAFDPSGNLWVTDQGNNRVLEFKSPFSTGEMASVVIGHANFTSFAPSSTVSAKSLSA